MAFWVISILRGVGGGLVPWLLKAMFLTFEMKLHQDIKAYLLDQLSAFAVINFHVAYLEKGTPHLNAVFAPWN